MPVTSHDSEYNGAGAGARMEQYFTSSLYSDFIFCCHLQAEATSDDDLDGVDDTSKG